MSSNKCFNPPFWTLLEKKLPVNESWSSLFCDGHVVRLHSQWSVFISAGVKRGWLKTHVSVCWRPRPLPLPLPLHFSPSVLCCPLLVVCDISETIFKGRPCSEHIFGLKMALQKNKAKLIDRGLSTSILHQLLHEVKCFVIENKSASAFAISKLYILNYKTKCYISYL